MEDNQVRYESPSERNHHDHNNINPWEDQGSLATGDTNRNNTNQGLPIKIKKGNNNNNNNNNSEEETAHNNNNEHPLRVCHICNKGFNTGKALGGHMRMHAISNKQAHKSKKNKQNKNNTGVIVDDRNPTCSLCKKSFFSLKALYGHMRSHPDREWRGIQPPTTSTTTTTTTAATNHGAFSNSTSSSSTLSDNSAINLSSSLKGWSVTAKRGHKSLSSDSSLNLGVEDEDEEKRMQEAVYGLMWLAREDPKTVVECKDTYKMKRKVSGKFSSVSIKLEDRMEEEDSDSKNSDGSNVGIDMENKNKNSNKKKKLTKKMKLNEIGKAEQGNKFDAVAVNRYNYKSYQAFGGHLSNHKISNNIQTMDQFELDAVSVSESMKQHAKTTTMPGDETKTSVEDALVCSNSTVENGQNCPKILSFDLNLPPAMDEDEGIQLNLFSPTNMVPSSYHASSSQNSVTNW